jgi:murein DD-endopeptidase / murein LD-carboxypeptidase
VIYLALLKSYDYSREVRMMKTNFLRKTLLGATCFLFVASASGVAFKSANAAAVSTQATVQANVADRLTHDQKMDKIIAKAKSLQGKVTYKFGVNNPSKLWFDCSSFTKYVFGSQGIDLKWGSKAQSKQGVYVAKKNLQPGDLIFLSVGTKGQVNHVGIYIGNGKFIHNTIGKHWNGLLISDLNSGSYPSRYITARRVG